MQSNRNIIQFKGSANLPSKNGYVSLWRDIKKQPWYSNSECLAVFTHIMISATSKPATYNRKGAVCELMPGEFVTTYQELADQFDLDKSKVRRIIETFEKNGQITKSQLSVGKINKGLKLSLKGWDKWQNNTNFSDTQTDTQTDTPEVTYLKGLTTHADTHPDTQTDTVLNNKVINNNKYTCKNSDEFSPEVKSQIPNQEIVKLFGEILPALPQPKKLTAARLKSIRARHVNDLKSDLENWRKYFTYVRDNCSWMVNGQYNITFDYLIKQSNFQNILEGAKNDRNA